MLFYSVFCVYFLAILAPNSETKEQLKPETDKSEAIFADVIKNISRVNNVLQELINNYEHLQKIYKSQENFDHTEYSSEGEVDRFYKNSKKDVRNNKEKRSFKNEPMDGPMETSTTFNHGTQMIISDMEDENNENSHEVKTEKPISKKSKPPTKEKMKNVEKKTTVQKTMPDTKKPPYSGEISGSQETIEIKQKVTKTTRAVRAPKTTVTTTITMTTTTAEKLIKPMGHIEAIEHGVSIKEPKEPKQMESEIIFVDTHKKIKNKTDRKKPRIMPEIALEKAPKKPKTRYSVKDAPGANENTDGFGSLKTHDLRETRNSSKRLLQMVPFSKDKSSSVEVFTSRFKVAAEKKALKKNETTPETKVLLSLRSEVNNTKKAFNANDKLDRDGLSEMTDDDDALTKDVFKTSVLRQAYGDACLKLVVKKCYKACKDTLKSSCRAAKCPSRMKSCYKKTYKARCDIAFEDTPGLTLRRYLKTEGVHDDMTRAGYLSVACQPALETRKVLQSVMFHNETPNRYADQNKDKEPNADQNKDKEPNADHNKGKELNILRDKYERACSRISRDKCFSACNYAQNATCIKFECEKKLKKNFRRNCKSYCKRAYTSSSSKKGSDSDSESGSGSYSGSDSESGSSESNSS